MPIYNEEKSFNDLIGSSGSKPTNLEFSLARTTTGMALMKFVQKIMRSKNNFR